MVEFYPIFEKDDAEIIADDYLDLIIFEQPVFAKILQENGFKPISEYIGLTQEQNDIINQNAPPQYRQPWREELSNWSSPDTALQLLSLLRNAVTETPDQFNEWEGMLEEVLETIKIGERVFRRAKVLHARWHIGSPGF